MRASAMFASSVGLRALGACLCAFVTGCTSGAPIAPSAAAARPIVIGPAAARGVGAEFSPSFEALQAALDEGDTRTARAILRSVWSMHPTGPARALAVAYDHIVVGRECAAGLALTLECRPAESPTRSAPSDESMRANAPPKSGLTHVVLCAASALRSDIALRPGPATLVVTRTAVDAHGNEQRSVETRSFADLGELALPAGGKAEVALVDLVLPRAIDALAVRLRLELDMRSGLFVRAGRELPAQSLRVGAGEATALAAPLEALGTASARELADLARPGKISTVRALEVAVRVAPADRGAALDDLWPLAGELPETDVARLVPALRWLALTSEPGGDPEAWRAYLRGRANPRRGAPVRDRLELPEPRAARESDSQIALERSVPKDP